MTGIYKITNKLNGKSYIGQSIHCGRRLDEHCTGDQFIDQTIQVEGIQNFNFEILKEVKKEELSYWEDYYIIKYNTMFPNGYNKRWNCSGEIRREIEKELKKDEGKKTHLILREEDYDDIIYEDNNITFKEYNTKIYSKDFVYFPTSHSKTFKNCNLRLFGCLQILTGPDSQNFCIDKIDLSFQKLKRETSLSVEKVRDDFYDLYNNNLFTICSISGEKDRNKITCKQDFINTFKKMTPFSYIKLLIDNTQLKIKKDDFIKLFSFNDYYLKVYLYLIENKHKGKYTYAELRNVINLSQNVVNNQKIYSILEILAFLNLIEFEVKGTYNNIIFTINVL